MDEDGYYIILGRKKTSFLVQLILFCNGLFSVLTRRLFSLMEDALLRQVIFFFFSFLLLRFFLSSKGIFKACIGNLTDCIVLMQ